MSETDAAAGAPESPVAVVVMGVAGAGKSTLAVAIAERLDAAFIEADDLHFAEAKTQMGFRCRIPIDLREWRRFHASLRRF